MKRHIILPIILSCCVHMLTAQVHTALNFNLNDTLAPSQNVTYRARDYISLTSGFYGDASGGELQFEIDPGLIYSISGDDYINQNTIENRTLDTDLDFGSAAGRFGVSRTGGATYSVPIYSPPGYGTLTPSLAVSYNNSLKDGVLGCGWDLSGVSTLHRLPKNIHHDSTVSGIQMDQTDILALDGNRLVLQSGTYGQSGSKYRTRSESFSTIEAFGTTGNGPAYFKVTAGNGYIYEYGNSTDSKVEVDDQTTIAAWRLNKVTDPHSNYIVYEYDNSVSGQAYLNSIKYTGNSDAGLEPYNEIRVFYQLREDNSFGYLAGKKLEDTYLVRKITVETSGILQREYDFHYFYKLGTFLSEVIESNGDQEQYNSTVIGWNSYADTVTETATGGFNDPTTARFADFNDDGYDDYLSINQDSPDFTAGLYLNDGTGGFAGTALTYQFTGQSYVEHLVDDFNADGRSDAVVVSVDTCWWENGQETLYEAYYKFTFLEYSSGNVVLMDSYDLHCQCGGTGNILLPWTYSTDDGKRFFTGDVNGDGFADFMVNGTEGMILYGDVDGEDFQEEEVNIPVDATQNLLSDFNGDGMADYATFVDGVFTVYEIEEDTLTTLFTDNFMCYKSLFHYGDFNGDGNTDLYYYQLTKGWYWKYGTGSGMADTIFDNNFYDPLSSTYSVRYEVNDFNRDGMDDLLLFTDHPLDVHDSLECTFLKSNGNNSFSGVGHFYTRKYFDFTNIQFCDLDGDGQADLITPGEDSCFRVNPGDQHYLVRFIEDGTGIRTTIGFNTLNKMNGDSYTRSGSYSFPMRAVNDPLWLVSSVETTSALHDHATVSKTKYSYTDMVIHQQGLGFLGFQKVETTKDSIYQSEVFNSFTAPDYYAWTDSVRTSYSNNLSGSVQQTKNYLTKALSGGMSYFVYSDLQKKYDYLNSQETETDPSYDTSGNLTSTRTTYDDGSYQEALYYDYLSDGSIYPQKVIKRQKHKDDTSVFSSETRYAYDTVSYEMEAVIGNYGKSNQVTTQYLDYDDFGNPGEIELQPQGLTKQSVEFEYSSTGRFMLSRSTSQGEKTYTYDDRTGSPLSETDMYGNVIIYEYDPWGNLSKSTTTDSITRTIEINWADTGDPSSTLYTVKTSGNESTYEKRYTDYKGRVFKTGNEGFDGDVYYTDTRFNELNQTDSVSNLYLATDSPLWNTFAYRTADGRISSESHVGGASVSYSYGNTQVTKTINNNDYTTDFDAMGNVTNVEDPLGNEIDYTYFSHGGYKTLMGNGGTLSFVYNDAGLDSTSTDPSLGTTQKSYNALGQVTWIRDGKGNEFDISYDTLYRLTRKENANDASEYYTYAYVTTGNGKGQIDSVSYTNGSLTSTVSYTYDEHGKVSTESKKIGSKTYSLSYQYDGFGRMDSVTDSNQKKTDYQYDTRGYLTEIWFDNENVWELDDLDLTGRTEKLGANITLNTSFDNYGYPSSIQVDSLFDMSYSFSAVTGNLASRTQKIFNVGGLCTHTLSESFTYDDLNRLLEIISSGDEVDVSYDGTKEERIYSKSDAGALYNYKQLSPFQLESIDSASTELIGRPDMEVCYTSFNKVDSIAQGDFLINFDYGPNSERVRMEVYKSDTLQYTRYYFGSYELTEYPDGSYNQDTWLAAEGGLFAFNRKTASTDSLYYVITDHLGSIMTVANQSGNAVEQFSYDAWGRRRNATDWCYDTTLTATYTTRGYTGHEHMDETGLINMNGRIYDPLVGLFISPDPMLQNPMNPLNYNRYSYVTNNPLKYTDPSGYIFSSYMENLGRATDSRFYSFGFVDFASWGAVGGGSLGTNPTTGYYGYGGNVAGVASSLLKSRNGGHYNFTTGKGFYFGSPEGAYQYGYYEKYGTQAPSSLSDFQSYTSAPGSKSNHIARVEYFGYNGHQFDYNMMTGDMYIPGTTTIINPALVFSGVIDWYGTGGASLDELYSSSLPITTSYVNDPPIPHGNSIESWVIPLPPIFRGIKLARAAKLVKKFPGINPAKAPKGFKWRGKQGSTPGSKNGNWFNSRTGESLRPDLDHPGPIGPHWDYRDHSGVWWRIFPDGRVLPK